MAKPADTAKPIDAAKPIDVAKPIDAAKPANGEAMSWGLDAFVTTVANHAVGALVVLGMPHDAIDSAQLVLRLDGMNVVRSRPANATRFAGVFDINVFQTSRFGFGGAILLRADERLACGCRSRDVVRSLEQPLDSLWCWHHGVFVHASIAWSR